MKTINLYEFKELGTEQQKRVLNDLADINVDFAWYDGIYDEAKNLGFKITGFDLDRGNYCSITLIDSPREISEKIIKDHGTDCATYKMANTFLSDYAKFVKTGGENLEGLIENFENELAICYRDILKAGYEYLTSEEAIIETIELNSWTFEANGNMCNN